MKVRGLLVSLVALVFGGSVFASFTDVSESVGILYQHANKDTVPTNEELGLDRETYTPVSNHAGAAAFDADGDGWTDFIGGRYALPPVLFMNQGDGTFSEDGSARGLDLAVDAATFAAGDFDNDGDQDLFVAPHRGERFFFFLNDGNGVFSEAAVERGAALSRTEEPHEGHSIGLVDFDLDGYLDVYVSEWGPTAGLDADRHSVLLRNRGAEAPGFFENLTAAAGLIQPEEGVERQHGFSTGWADFDEDGWPDLALMADFGGSRLYWNQGNGSFSEGTDSAGVGLDEFGMGVAVADYDLDGDLDYYATSIYNQKLLDATSTNTGNKLYQNIGGRKFEEVARASGVHQVGWSWGAVFFEYDNDGDPDLMVTNGMDTATWDPFFYLEALDDPTTVFQNGGTGRFSNITTASGVSDDGYGKALVVLDYDNDGDEDVIVTQTFGSPIVYRSNASENGRKWIRFKLEGEQSNRDGVGAVVSVTDGDKTQTAVFNPSNAYMGQREGVLHFGLGAAGESVDRVEIRWPSGIRQVIENLDTNFVHPVLEPDLALVAPQVTLQPVGGNLAVGDTLELRVEALSDPAATYVWEKDGKPVFGATQSSYEIKRLQPYDAGSYRVRVINPVGETLSEEAVVTASIDLEKHSIARWWNEFLLASIRKDFPDPTKHSRNLYHMSAVLWDAYWAYEPNAWARVTPVFHKELLSESDWGASREDARREAMSYACYRMLRQRYANSVSAERIRYNIDWLMEQLGYDVAVETVVGNSPAAVGNRIAAATIAETLNDGSNEANGYADTSGYAEANEPMAFELPGTEMADPNRWQPLAFDFRVTQNGLPESEKVQSFVGVNWREVDTFAIEKDSGITIAWDPGPPPLFGMETHDAFVESAVEVIRYSAFLDPSSSELIDVSPGALLNNPLGTNDGQGRSVNPYTGLPYAENRVKHADYGRILAEFWADGPASETPPGHWNSLLNEVSDDPLFERRYLGIGDALSELEWNVQSYLALNGAMHDAAVAAWTLKRQYDYSRPVSMIRYLGGLGQSSDPSGLSYHEQGLPLVEGLIEIVTEASSAAGERHEHLAFEVGEIAIRSWAGEPADSHSQVGGVDWILAEEWMPYQRSTFVTPAFAAYVSGHSCFSRAGAEALALLTGSPFFPGGKGEFHFEKNGFLEFEAGPSEDLTLEWATYFDAADQAGLSRLYGGIHVRADDFIGRTLGARIGVEAFLKAHALRGGAVSEKAFAGAQISYRFSSEGAGSFVTLDFDDGRGRPIWSVASMEDAEARAGEGVYFVLNEGIQVGGVSEGSVVVKSAALSKVVISSELESGAPASVRFSISEGEARMIAIRAWTGSVFGASRESSGARPEIVVYRVDEDGESLVSSNSKRETGATDSVFEVLALRGGLSGEEVDLIEAGLVVSLPTGDYRVELRNAGGAGQATIEVEEVR
ncbi:FG-GAP repeat domain protein [Verrucomicrobiia bacterium DG1235]|nr:FG-GAP repeat domain protein [Verrucomicrobiae bacterium DG1235]